MRLYDICHKQCTEFHPGSGAIWVKRHLFEEFHSGTTENHRIHLKGQRPVSMPKKAIGIRFFFLYEYGQQLKYIRISENIEGLLSSKIRKLEIVLFGQRFPRKAIVYRHCRAYPHLAIGMYSSRIRLRVLHEYCLTSTPSQKQFCHSFCMHTHVWLNAFAVLRYWSAFPLSWAHKHLYLAKRIPTGTMMWHYFALYAIIAQPLSF